MKERKNEREREREREKERKSKNVFKQIQNKVSQNYVLLSPWMTLTQIDLFQLQ